MVLEGSPDPPRCRQDLELEATRCLQEAEGGPRPALGGLDISHKIGTHLINECVFFFFYGIVFFWVRFLFTYKNAGRLIGFITYTYTL